MTDSSNRVCLPGPEQLQPPSSEPPYDFMCTDVEGKLTGEPGTLCYIECKATSADLSSSSSSRPLPMPITAREWGFAQMVHAQRLAGAERREQYVIVRVERVDRPGQAVPRGWRQCWSTQCSCWLRGS